MQNEDYTDPKLEFEMRCAFAKEHIDVDANEALGQLKSKNADDSDNEPILRHGERRTTMLTFMSLAAACVAILFCFVYINKVKVDDHPEGLSIYHAQVAIPEKIQITVGDKEISLDGDEAKDNNIVVTDDDVIEFSTPSILDEAAITQTNTLRVPHGKVATVLLPDGTKVWLSPGSRLIFPSLFPTDSPREVKLIGEAYFCVTHDESHPFIVNCDRFTTKVLGTEFNVRNYDNETPVVTLVEGSVNVSHGTENLTLKPEQCVSVDKDARLVAKTADLDVITSWKNGEFYFDGQTLRQIVTEIGRWYNMDVVVLSDAHVDDSIHFNGERAWSLSETVQHLQRISKVRLEVRDNTLLLK